MIFVSVPGKHLNTTFLNWSTEPHTDPRSWFEVDYTESMEIAVSITKESVLHPPSKHCVLDSAPLRGSRQVAFCAEGSLKAHGEDGELCRVRATQRNTLILGS